MQRCVVRQWVKRFLASGIAGLYDQPRPGRKPLFPLGGKLTRRETSL
ncbi:MAG: helix-turn-helix domain-containing protein [Thermoleophilia bacterium]|nr:helix-turn-helix domain-containing protein [Thermoleophilia bacterium]